MELSGLKEIELKFSGSFVASNKVSLKCKMSDESEIVLPKDDDGDEVTTTIAPLQQPPLPTSKVVKQIAHKNGHKTQNLNSRKINDIEMPGIFSSPFVSSKVTATTTKEQKYTQPKKESIIQNSAQRHLQLWTAILPECSGSENPCSAIGWLFVARIVIRKKKKRRFCGAAMRCVWLDV